MHACPREPVSCHWERERWHPRWFFPQLLRRTGYGMIKIKCCVPPVQSFWLFQMNTWKTFSTSLTLPFTFLYGNQGPVSIQLRGQCCPLTFIASLPNSWMGAKSDWSHGSQEELACLSVKILFSISNQAHFSFCIIKYSFFDQRWETLVHSNSPAWNGRLSEMQTLSFVSILKKKKKKEALKSVISIEVKSINSNILELANCHLLLFFFTFWVLLLTGTEYLYQGKWFT